MQSAPSALTNAIELLREMEVGPELSHSRDRSNTLRCNIENFIANVQHTDDDDDVTISAWVVPRERCINVPRNTGTNSNPKAKSKKTKKNRKLKVINGEEIFGYGDFDLKKTIPLKP